MPPQRGKDKYDRFHLSVRFSFALKSPNGGRAAVEARVKSWIDIAEACYDARPALKIRPEWNWSVRGAPSDVRFKNSRELSKFMDDRFDNIVGENKADGCLQVLVVDSVGYEDGYGLNGHSFFPHCVAPFGRKHGIIMDADPLPSTFAHELGHMLSLKHTFGTYVGTKRNCNQDYRKGASGQGGTRKGARINLMDYKRKAGDSVFLNPCQKERAASQRRRYMTTGGETNYRRLKGIR